MKTLLTLLAIVSPPSFASDPQVLYAEAIYFYRAPVTAEGGFTAPVGGQALGDGVLVAATPTVLEATPQKESWRMPWGNVPSFRSTAPGRAYGAPEFGDTAWPGLPIDGKPTCLVWGNPPPKLLARCHDAEFVAKHAGVDYRLRRPEQALTGFGAHGW